MSADDYLAGILTREAVDTSWTSPVWAAKEAVMPLITRWAGHYLQSVNPSGSFAKGTANRSGTDIDLFISLSMQTPDTLHEVYETLFNALTANGYAPRRQDVSLGVRIGWTDVDLVPAKQQNVLSQDHSLYRRKANTWTKTNVQTHITHVLLSGRQAESRVLKLWRTQRGLDFPSFYLELAVIQALRTSIKTGVASRVWEVLEYFAGDFPSSRFIDPANTNNIISDDLTEAQKNAIKAAAQASLRASNWGEIVR